MHDNQPGQRIRRWPLFLVAAPAAVSIWSGWVGLGQLCGFGIVHPLPGILDGLRLNTAITLPVGVEAYGAYALGAWLTPGTSGAARRFAKRSAVGSLALGMLGQVAYHLMSAAHATRAPWSVTVLVACLPVVTLGFGAALTHLLRSAEPASEPDIIPTVKTVRTPGRPPLSVAWSRPEAVTAPRPATSRTQPPTPRKAKRARTTSDKAAAIIASQPGISGAELGRRLRVSDRQGRRILADLMSVAS